MSPDVERYLRRATRGLWGAKRHLVQAELRGVLEDKIWRHRLSGHSEPEATRLALQDLGEARTIAREMSAVHTLPQGMQLMGLLAVCGALGFLTLTRGLAQVPAAPLSYARLTCDISPEGQRLWQQNFTAEQQRLRAITAARPGERAFCDRVQSYAYEFVDRDLLLQALTAQGARVSATPPPGTSEADVAWGKAARAFPNGAALRWLTFPGDRSAVPLMPLTRDGQQLLAIVDLIYGLLSLSHQPITLEGEVNPRVTVGKTSFTLGTDQTPVSANLLRVVPLMNQIVPILMSGPTEGASTTYVADPTDPLASPRPGGPPLVRLRVKLPDGATVGVLIRDLLPRSGDEGRATVPEFQVYTARVRQGEVILPAGAARNQVRVVDTFRELKSPFGGNVSRRVLLMQLQNPNDLSNLGYLVVPPDAVQ